MATAKAKTSGQHDFQAEVAKLLHLMVHSVYSEREIFLRELISNAADACDKLRYDALSEPALLAGDPDLKITISCDSKAKVLTVADNGVGMSDKEMIANLGTIARSGTQAFMEQVSEPGDVQLIGQFGIGFYSAFMVAEKVDVVSRRAGAKKAYIWTSDGSGTFTVEPCKAADAPKRGTVIRLHLREGAQEFAETGRLETIVKMYSDHIAHPINLAIDAETTRQINSASAIWARPKSEVTEDQYKEFFGHAAGIYSDPALTLHYKAEGRNEYTVLLCVPGEAPFDLYEPERRGRQKLYVRRVFITSEAELLPSYLRFVRGVIDSEDMPLNISREMLQDNPTVHAIRKAVTNRVLSELAKCADKQPETFTKIWDAFGPVLKEGLYEDPERRDQLFEIARFRSTKTDEQAVTLKDYAANLAENQTAIYYLAGEDAAKISASPQLEGFKARGVEVLLLCDPIDSFWVRTSLGYDGKPFKSATQGIDDLDAIPLKDDADKPEQDKAAIATLIAAMKQSLGEGVNDVRTSTRLTTSPCCLVADGTGLDRGLEKMLSRQSGSGVKTSAPVLEINPGHALIGALASQAKSDGASEDLASASRLLLDQAYILDGEPVTDPQGFSDRLTAVLAKIYAA